MVKPLYIMKTKGYRATLPIMYESLRSAWNTVYIERVNEDWYQYLSPLGWGHINLTGDYIWQENKDIKQGSFRPLRTMENP